MSRLEIVVDGTDSGGKTPCVAALRDVLAGGCKVSTCAPFRVQEVYELWAREPSRAAEIIRSIMDDFRSRHGSSDVIIWDRGWPTVWVSTSDPAARQLLLPFPELTVLLLNSMETTRTKAEKYGLRSVWVDDPALVRRYHDAYHALPSAMTGADISAFFPSADGRYDYAEICQGVRRSLGLS
jgi:hypothetical protein